MPFGRRSPLEAALAIPGAILAFKYSQFRERRREAASRRVTERELSALHHKIDKLLSKLEESEPEQPTSQEDECVICINARATMQTSPCGHRVVCRRCFVKTIQSAVAQRLLPLRCVICRARINRLTSGTGSWRLQGSASSYSMGSKSWNVPGSASSYSVGAERVIASASLYSMSSGSSCVSNTSSEASGMSSSSSCGHNSNSSNKTPHGSCASGCLGAIPRNPNFKKGGHHYPKIKALDMPNRLPPIKEFNSPARIVRTSPVHVTNPKFRFASYTAPPKLHETVSVTIEQSTSLKPSSTSKVGLTSRISPMNSKSPINKTNMATGKVNLNGMATGGTTPRVIASSINKEEKADNRKNESMERKKKEEKLKIKAEKDARKEDKRLAKEEERLAKMLAKEEKKRNKKEAKEALLSFDFERK